MKGIGKPCTGKLFARFDEGGLALPALYSTHELYASPVIQPGNYTDRCCEYTVTGVVVARF